MAVPDYAPPKVAGERCPDLCSRGCRIYAARPGSCRSFACVWLQGAMPKQFRPDRVGVVFTADNPPSLKGEQRIVGLIGPAGPAETDLNSRLVRWISEMRRHGVEIVLHRLTALPSSPI